MTSYVDREGYILHNGRWHNRKKLLQKLEEDPQDIAERSYKQGRNSVGVIP